jgi:hypothetical protein
MPQVTLEITVTPKGVAGHWINLDGKPLTNGTSATVDIDTGNHELFWHAVGNPGGTLQITGTVNGAKVVDAQGEIPDIDDEDVGLKDFTVQS